jgi:hypothetical protein
VSPDFSNRARTRIIAVSDSCLSAMTGVYGSSTVKSIGSLYGKAGVATG